MSSTAAGARTKWAWVAGTFFGAGNLKPGPGTWGSVSATLLWWAVLTPHFFTLGKYSFDSVVPVAPLWPTLLAVLVITAIGIPAATIVARESGRKDPQNVVIDEVAGQWLTLAAAAPDWKHALVGLGLFRLFDITKPWPARQLEHLREGWGIMLDDLAAGVYGAIVMVVIRHWW